MSTRVTCRKCGASILSATAERTGGLCVPCKEGERRDLENMRPHPFTALSMDGYLALVRGLPLPTAEQRRNFVDYTATAHSWYKHLPAFLPGAPFYFFMDRAAGCDWLALKDGSYAIAQREKPGFHYSAIPTAEYRTRFGFLSYSCAEGTAVFLSAQPLAFPRDKLVAIPGEDFKLCCLPPPILDAGRAELTAVIHPSFADWPWEAQPNSPAVRTSWWAEPVAEALRTIHWPAESGGQMTLKRIFERVAYMRTPECREERLDRVAHSLRRRETCPTREKTMDESDDPFVDPVLRELLAPERLRQRTEMLKAIDRVCMLIPPPQQSAPDRNA